MTTENLICPACSAPISIVDTDQTVECGFCGDSFDVVRDDDTVRLELHSQPQPQAEEMAQLTQEVVEDLRQETDETIAEAHPGTIRRAEGDPVAPGFAASATRPVEPEAFVPGPAAGPTPYDPVQPAAAPPAARGRNPWVVLGLSVFVVFCLILLCAAGGILIYMRNNGLQLGF